MRKSKRILSFLMAILMLSSIFGVMASALAPYKDGAISVYDDLDKPVFTLDQCSSMVLDYADKTLKDIPPIDTMVLGMLDISSVDNALSGIYGLLGSSLFTSLSGSLGDLAALNRSALATARRASTPAATADTNVIYSLLSFLNDNKGIISKAIDGSLDMGLASSFVDLQSILNVNKIVKTMLYQIVHPNTKLEKTDPLYEATPDPVTDTADTMIQQLIDNLVVGTKVLDPITNEYKYSGLLSGIFYPLSGKLNIATGTDVAYDFGEDFLRNVYNLVLVPLLNKDFKKVIREICGVVYDDKIPNDPGNESNLNAFALDLNINYVIPTHTFAPGATLITDINTIFSEVISAVTLRYNDWIAGDNTLVLDNFANAAKYVLALPGISFFKDYVALATPAEIGLMDNQQLFSYIVRSLLNSSIDEMNIPADADTLMEVVWYALKEVLAQKNPQTDYSAQPKTLDGVLYLLSDFLVYTINQASDMNPAFGTLPGTGLVPYGMGLDNTLTFVMNWVKLNYGGLFNLPFNVLDTGWQTLDKIVFAVARANWLPVSINGSCKTLIVNRILEDILTLDTTSLFALFTHRADSEFATKTIKTILVESVARLFNLFFPGAFNTTYASFEELISNAKLMSIVEGLIYQLYTRRTSILPAVLPLGTTVLGINKPEEYTNPAIALPNQVSVNTTFEIRNDSSGVNTGATNKTGTFTQDALYKIKIVSVTPAFNASANAITVNNLVGTTINGGEAVNCTLSCTNWPAGNVLMVSVTYDVYTELGTKLTANPLTAMAFSYVSGTVDDGSNYFSVETNANNSHTLYYKNLYLTQNSSVSSIANAEVQVKRATSSATVNQTAATISRTASTVNASLVGVTPATFTDQATTYNGGTWNFKVYSVSPTAVKPADGVYTSNFSYSATATGTDAGAVENWALINKQYVVIYNDFGLSGLLNSEIDAQRDPTNYSDSAAWDEYIFWLQNAVGYQYQPRTAATFFTNGRAGGYEEAVNELKTAVTNLEVSELAAGVTPLRTALDGFQPLNTGLAYDDPTYSYMDTEDYVPYTYTRYSAERGLAETLWASQQAPVEPVEVANPTPAQHTAFLAEHALWVTALDTFNLNKPVLKPVQISYALHRLNLYGGRLIRVQAQKGRLSEDLARIQALHIVQGQYTNTSWAAYQKALAFAVTVNAASNTAVDGNGNWVLRQTKVNTARETLIMTHKQLVLGADYTLLDAEVVLCIGLVETNYTAESWAPFKTALTEAQALKAQALSNTDENQAKIVAATTKLHDAKLTLEISGGDKIIPAPGTGTIIDSATKVIYGLVGDDGLGAHDKIQALPGYSIIYHDTEFGPGTGSTVEVVQDGAKATSEFYTVILYGDINGDAVIDSVDAGIAVDVENNKVIWNHADPAFNCFFRAGDVNGDGNIDSLDAGIMVDSQNYMVVISQTTGRVVV